MPTEQGFSNQKKLGKAQFKTIHSLGSDSFGSKVAPASLYEKKAASAIVAVSSISSSNGQLEFYEIELTAHGASVGDALRMTSGPADGVTFEIQKIIDVDKFYVLPIATPVAGNTAEIMGWTISKTSKDGTPIVTISAAPIQYVLDGVDVEVEEDTVTPANSKFLPTKIMGSSGDQADVTGNNELKVAVDAMTSSIAIGDMSTGGTAKVEQNGGSGEWELLVKDKDSLSMLTDVEANTNSLLAQFGNANDVAATSDTADTGFISLFKRNLEKLTSLIALFPSSIGQKTKAGSLSVVLASDSDSLPVSGPLTDAQLRATAVPVSGPLTDAQLRATAVPVSGPLTDAQLRATAVPVSASSLPLPTGASTLAEQQTQSTRIGDVTETAPGTDTASSGLNGRLQRIAQRITSLIALFPASLGQTTMANSFAVTIASDQSALSVTQTALTATFQEDSTVSTVAETFTAPAGAKSCVIQAPSSNTVNLRIKIGGTASTTSGMVLEPGRSETFPFAGNISYCSESGSGQAINVHFGA